jgi:FkbH-like protein
MGSNVWLEALPPQPVNFRELCSQADTADGARGDVLRGLANHRLDGNALHRLSRSVTAAIAAEAYSPLSRFSLGMISNGTTELLVPALVGSAARHGIALSVVAAPFGVTTQAALNPDAVWPAVDLDAVLAALDHRAFFDQNSPASDAQQRVDRAVTELSAIAHGLRSTRHVEVILQTLIAPPERLFGSFDRRYPGTLAWLVDRFNARLCDELVGPGIALLDVGSLAAAVGSLGWHDVSQWLTARLPFSQAFVPSYAEHVARLLGAMRGKSRRVLVLDLDNTLWGGVVADDGLEHLRLGQGDPVGEAFIAVQHAALALSRRGVLLAICSKNDEALALQALREHPEMVLRESDFSAIEINWRDKASNLESIAEHLSLGLDSFVFFDDSPAERAQVRAALPQVFVPEMPDDPAGFARVLLTAGVFETTSFSDEDKTRVQQYSANTKRHELLASSRDLRSFLEGLEMEATFAVGSAVRSQRVAELINKTNQFNLTGQHYTEAQVLAMLADPQVLTLEVRLRDRFGDNGVISAVICRARSANEWLIDTWVMSCRVIGRHVEIAVLNEVARRALAAGVRYIIGVYDPTTRNHVVSDLYAKLGFSMTQEAGDERCSVLDLSTFSPRDVPIHVISQSIV